VENDVLFFGKIKSTESILPCADLFMLPSDAESFGVSALEAMASGVPVISTNVGGMPEVQQHGVTGFLSNVGDYEDMAANAIRLLTNEKLHHQFSEQSKKRAAEFDVLKILPQYEVLYQSVISKSK
jgi:glycosyltransferase involved in cell wall biosynthesis